MPTDPVVAALVSKWTSLMLEAPPKPQGKPSPEAMTALKAHKDKMKAFKAGLSDTEAAVLNQYTKSRKCSAVLSGTGTSATDCTEENASSSIVGKSVVHKGLTLLPAAGPVSVMGGPAMLFHGVIPFYSHTCLRKVVKRTDAALGIDRRVFSNLFPEELRLRLGPEHEEIKFVFRLMRHAFLATTPGNCSESFFQAAKMELEADAKFIMLHLDTLEVAKYGQGRLALTDLHRDQLIACGVAADGIVGSQGSWKRNPPRRDDWEEVKLSWMLYLMRCKFLPGSEGAALTKAQRVAAALARRFKDKGQHWLTVEHTVNDSKWGDGSDGSGTNLLGRCISQVLLEASGAVPALEVPVDTARIASVSNLELVQYVRGSALREASELGAGLFTAGASTSKSNLDYIIVLDFEATCDKSGTPQPQEIIEFPSLLVEVASGEVVSEFHEYVKPDVHANISAFCTELTGITQAMTSAGSSLRDVLKRHRAWLLKHGLSLSEGDGGKSFAYVTCGDWDLRSCLPKQLKYHGAKMDSYLTKYINIKSVFFDVTGKSGKSMAHMLKVMDMELEGRHHSGIDDCRNIHRIAKVLLSRGWTPSL